MDDFSLMSVQFDTDDLPVARRVKQGHALRAGQLCEVEIGATLGLDTETPQHQPGVYMLCIVERVEPDILHVRLVSSTSMPIRER
jgi:hypothetical protein